MLKKLSLALFLLIGVFTASAAAQTDDSPEKQAVVKQIVGLINEDNKAEDLFQKMLPIMQFSQKQFMKTTIADRNDLTAAEKASLEKSMLESFDKINRQMMEKFVARLNYNEIMNEIMASVYDKYYTLEELKDIAAFYQTTTGRKTLKMITPISLETMRLTQEKLTPKIQAIIKEIMDESRAEMERSIKSRKSNR